MFSSNNVSNAGQKQCSAGRVLATIAKTRGPARLNEMISRHRKSDQLHRHQVVKEISSADRITVDDLFPDDLVFPRQLVRSVSSLEANIVPSRSRLPKSSASLYKVEERQSFSLPETNSEATINESSNESKRTTQSASVPSSILLWELDALANINYGKINWNDGPAWKTRYICCADFSCTRDNDANFISKLRTSFTYSPSFSGTAQDDESTIYTHDELQININDDSSLIEKTSVSFNSDCLLKDRYQWDDADEPVDDDSDIFVPVTLLPRDSMEFVTPTHKSRASLLYAEASIKAGMEEKILEPLFEDEDSDSALYATAYDEDATNQLSDFFDVTSPISGVSSSSKLSLEWTQNSSSSLNNMKGLSESRPVPPNHDSRSPEEAQLSDKSFRLTPNWFRHAIESRRQQIREDEITAGTSYDSLNCQKNSSEKSSVYLLDFAILKNSPLLEKVRQRSTIFRPPRLSSRDSLEWMDPIISPTSEICTDNQDINEICECMENLHLKPRRNSSC